MLSLNAKDYTISHGPGETEVHANPAYRRRMHASPHRPGQAMTEDFPLFFYDMFGKL